MSYDSRVWNEIKDKIETNLSNENLVELNNGINALFCRFDELPSNKAWELALKVYNNYKSNPTLIMNFVMGIPTNFNILPNKEEAWTLYEQIPTNIDPIFKNEANFWLVSYLQENSDKIPVNKVWNLLKISSEDIDPKIRGEAGYTICEYIGKSDKFPKKDAWNIINILIKDPEKIVKQRILSAFSDFYSDLPKKVVWNLTINLSKVKSKKIRDSCLNVAIEKSKDQIKSKDYLDASSTLEQILNELKNCSRFGWIRFVFLGILLFIGIYIVKDTWIYVLNNMPYLFLGIVLLLLIFWKLLKLKVEKYMILFYFAIIALPILLLFPLPYVILNWIIPISPTNYNIIVFGIIPSLIIPFMISRQINISIKLITRNPRFNLANGLYNYYIGRYYIQKYIDSESKVKLEFLKDAIKKFSKATESYNKLLFGFKDELSICPYCLNFYQGINIYENLLRKPKDSSVKDLEKQIDQSISVMEETNKGSNRLTQLLKELLNFTKVLVELQKKRQNISHYDSVEKMEIDKEIKEKSYEIDKKIGKIDLIISEIEDQNLPLIIEIMKKKRAELDDLSISLKKEGFKGFDKYYAGEEYSLIGILLLIIGIAMLFIGGLYSPAYLLISVTLLVIGSIIISFAKIKRTI